MADAKMRLRRCAIEARDRLEIEGPTGWIDLARALRQAAPALAPAEVARLAGDLIAFLAAPKELRDGVSAALSSMAPSASPAGETPLLPFAPRSFRDFMLYERHAVDAAHGFVRDYMPWAKPIAAAYERLTGSPFPPLKPKPLWYRQPIYYMGNHLAIVPDGAAIPMPPYTRHLDWELELGFVLASPLRDASPLTAEAAIGGFVLVNDFSARDVQLAEMRSGFGPQKAKHFATAVSSVVVTADVILPRWTRLKGRVLLDGDAVAEVSAAGPQWSLGEALAHASRGETLHAGELFATGTLPGGSGIEIGRRLAVGNEVTLELEGIGSLTNTIVASTGAPA